MGTNWSLWDRLRSRYEAARPRRMLALDGGGIRGLLTLQVGQALAERVDLSHLGSFVNTPLEVVS